MAKRTEQELFDPLAIAMGSFRTVAHFLIFKAGLSVKILHDMLDEIAEAKEKKDAESSR